MTIGVLWEFFEYGADKYFHTDMQKDQIVENIYSVSLNPEGKNVPIKVEDITETQIITEDNTFVVSGYLDIGLIDTMGDLLVNFVGATVYCIIGFIYVKKRDNGSLAQKFIVRMKD